MAHAGGAAQSIELQIIDGQLWATGKLYRLSEYLIDDVDEALARLERGERVLLKMLGGNLAELQARAEALGVEVIRDSHKVPGV